MNSQHISYLMNFMKMIVMVFVVSMVSVAVVMRMPSSLCVLCNALTQLQGSFPRCGSLYHAFIGDFFQFSLVGDVLGQHVSNCASVDASILVLNAELGGHTKHVSAYFYLIVGFSSVDGSEDGVVNVSCWVGLAFVVDIFDGWSTENLKFIL